MSVTTFLKTCHF